MVKVENTDVLLASGGKTDYRIVIPDDADDTLRAAADELTEFFERATGAKPVTVTDRNAVYAPNAKILSLGKNAYAASAGIEPEDVGTDGFNIFTKGNSVFMLGNTSRASFYAVQDFMHYTFGYEAYTRDRIAVDVSPVLKLKKLTVRSVPAFENRFAPVTYIWDDPVALRRLRFRNPFDWLINCGHDIFATTRDLVPYEIYFDEVNHPETYHPEYYRRTYVNVDVGEGKTESRLEVQKDKQGNPAEINFANREVWNVALENMKKLILANPDRNAIMFGQMDVAGWGESDEEKAELEKYGGKASATVVLACNWLAKNIREWLAEAEPGRKVQVGMFAYLASRDAPVKSDGRGGLEPYAPELALDEDVFVMLAPIETDYRYGYDDPVNPVANRQCADAIKGWGAICDKVFLWGYDINFCHFFIPFNCYNTLQDMYRFYKKNNAVSIFNEGIDGHATDATAFADLRLYLESKLAWNVDIDMKQTVAEFMQGCYGEAGDAMQKYYDGMIELTTYNYHTLGMTGQIYYDIEQARYWPKGTLDTWIGYFDEAYAAIEPLKTTDPAEYAAIKKLLDKEKLAPLYLLIILHGAYYTDVELMNIKYAFRALERETPLTQAREFNNKNDGKGVLVNELYAYWGIQ